MKRYWTILLISVLFFAGLGFSWTTTHTSSSAKTTMFLTIATQDSYNPEQAEVAATYFGETIMGWFRNPSFTQQILQNSQIQNASLSALKQERQNMLVEVQAATISDAQAVATETLTQLKTNVERYNNQTQSKFVVIDQGRTTRITNNNGLVFPIAGALFGLILALVLLAFKEFAQDEVSSVEEAEEILGIKALEFLNKKWEKNDYTLLSVAIQKASPLIILAGVGIDTAVLAVALAHKHSFFGEKIALVDGDLQKRELQETLGLSSRMKNLKGHTDIMNNDEEENNEMNSMILVQNTLDENLKFLAAGQGQKFLAQVFTSIAQQMKTLIHTQLPENSEALRLTHASLILVVEVGATKTKDLKRIKEIWTEDMKLIIVE